MKILIVSSTFYPECNPRSFRTTELVQELCRKGHDVTLYIPQIDYDYREYLSKYPIHFKYYNRVVEKRRFIGISIIDRIIFRLLNQFCAYPTSAEFTPIYKAVCKESGYDLLITIAVPHSIHWVFGQLYAKGIKAAKTWIADCGDPFMLAQSGNYRPPFYFKPLEVRWCKQCDYISVPTETSYLGYYPQFRNKIRVIPQAFDFDAVHIPAYQGNPVPTFLFAGVFIKGRRDPQKLLEFLCGIKKPFRFIVYGPNSHQFLDAYKDKLGDCLIIHDRIPRDQLLPIMAKADFLINIGNGTNVQTPSKLIDYTLAKRPILTIETNDIKQSVLMEFLNGDYRHKDATIDISRYDIHKVADQFIALCK